MTIKEKLDVQITAQDFVKARFLSAGVIRVGHWRWIVVADTLNKEAVLFRNSSTVEKQFQILGRSRSEIYSAWKSAMKELQKYEAGKKDNPFMEGVLG